MVNSKEKKIDLSNLQTGVYVVNVKTKQHIHSKKIVKK